MTLRYAVDFTADLDDNLAARWADRDAAFRRRLSAATHAVETRLALDPTDVGTELHGYRFYRELRFPDADGEVRVVFHVYPPRRLVEVTGITLLG